MQILNRAASDKQEALRDEYAGRFLTPWEAAERGFVPAVIDPEDTRAVVADALRTAGHGRGNTLAGPQHMVGPL